MPESLFTELEEVVRQREAHEREAARTAEMEAAGAAVPKQRQLLTGLDLIPGQQDLFPTDGEKP
jgi:hypothetical protein